MVAPNREKCGVADYSRYLLEELRALVDVVHVTDAGGFTPEMNQVDLIHIQHQYFLFGGVAPWKNCFPKFARKITAPAVMTVHEFVDPEGNVARKRAIELTNRRQFTNSRIRALVVHTGTDRDRMIAAGLPGSRIHVIAHGIPKPPTLPNRD